MLKLWEIPTDDLLQMGRRGLLPLLPLTREGRRREVVETAIGLLMPPGEEPNRELLSLVYGFASLMFESEDQDWLLRRFAMLYDILRETPAFQDMAREGMRQGLQQGREQGLQQGREEGEKAGALKNLRQVAVDLVSTRFAQAALTEWARRALERVKDTQKLHSLIVNLAIVQTPEEARQLLTVQQ